MRTLRLRVNLDLPVGNGQTRVFESAVRLAWKEMELETIDTRWAGVGYAALSKEFSSNLRVNRYWRLVRNAVWKAGILVETADVWMMASTILRCPPKETPFVDIIVRNDVFAADSW